MLQDRLPVRFDVEFPEVWAFASSEDFECRGFADSVGADEAEHLAGPWNGQPMQFEGIGRVAVDRLLFQVGWQVDNVNGPKRALFDAHPAANAQILRNEGNGPFGRRFNAQLPHPIDRAGPFALLFAFFRFALVRIDNGNTCQLFTHLCSVGVVKREREREGMTLVVKVFVYPWKWGLCLFIRVYY